MESQDGLPTPRRYWAMLATGLASTVAVLDTSIANVALPTIARGLNASEADAIWVINAYQIVLTVAILPLASLGDRVGHRTLYQIGLVLFTIASLACAVADSMPVMVAARAVQGLGAAGILSVSGALIRFTYPRDRLGQAIGINAMVVAAGSALGPTIASAILSVGSWRWLFGINVPLGVAAVILAVLALPKTLRSPYRFDMLSAVLSAAAFGLTIHGLDGLADRVSLTTGVEIVAGLGLGWIVVRRGLRMPAPLIPVDLLKVRSFALAAATNVCSFIAQGAAILALPFMMQANLGRTAVETGLLMTPWPVAAGLTAPFAGRLADRFPAGLLGGIGLAIFTVGLICLAGLPQQVSDPDIVWRVALCGVGFGLFQSPNNRSMMIAAPPERSGAAGGTISTARLIGQTLGAVMLAMLFRIEPHLATRLALGIAAAVAAGAAVVSSLRLIAPRAPDRPPPNRPGP